MVASGAAMVAIMLLTTVQILSRSMLHISFGGTVELVCILLIIVVFGGIAYCNLAKGHIKVDLVVNKLPPPARLVVVTCGFLLTTGIVFIISYQSAVQTLFLLRMHTHSGLLEVPLWPFAMATAFFMALLGLTFLLDFLEHLGELIANQAKNYRYLILGTIIVTAILVVAVRPNIVPLKLNSLTFGLISILLLFTLIFLRVPIGAAMAVAALFGANYLAAPGAGLAMLGIVSQRVASNYTWSVIPMFVLMGLFVSNAQFTRDIFKTVYTWLGHAPGGLASTTVGACGVFAAAVGDTLSGVLAVGPLVLPQMTAYKYDRKLATGSITAGSSIGCLIPPSLGLMVYGILVNQSIGKLFIAALLPGIIVTISFITLISIRCLRNPALGPPGPSTSFKEKILSVKSSWSIILLFVVVIGGIYTGIFTPTEAGAFGAFCALAMGLITKRFTSRSIGDAISRAIRTAATIFFIFIYANGLCQYFALTKIPFALSNFVVGLPVSRYVSLSVFLFFYLVGGCLMNTLPLLILTLPVIYPAMMALGFDPIWFAIIVQIGSEAGNLTPPIGMAVFAMSGIAPDVPLYDIFRGVIPFWLVLLAVEALLIAFPQIVLLLPSLMYAS